MDVAISKCDNYSEEYVRKSIKEVIELLGGLDMIKDGSKVAIKVNLVSAMKPEKSATTHPALLIELVKLLKEKNCEVIIGDSPGGPYNAMYLNGVYSATRMTELKEYGAVLNNDFSQEMADFKEGVAIKQFPYTAYLTKADYIINFSKLKSHGMMGMSVATKNLFGIIPGTQKPEFHFRFPNHNDFANMLIDLNEFLKPCLCIVDGVVAMEGNGPTAGVPKKVGLVLASKSPYKLDYICAKIIGLEKENVPTIEESYKRGLIPESVEDISTNIPINELVINDFDTRKVHQSLWFTDDNKLVGRIAKKVLMSKPQVMPNECVCCGKCKEVCPANAITMENGKPKIDRKKCITCFCCQEFCPKGAMKVKRSFIAKLLTK